MRREDSRLRGVASEAVAVLLVTLLSLAPLGSAAAAAQAAALDSAAPGVPAGALSRADAATRERVQAGLGKLPVYFIENRGQTDARAAYYVQGSATNVYFTKTGIAYLLTGRTGGDGETRTIRRHAIHLEFEGANPEVKVTGEDRAEAVVSYFKGPKESWKTGAATFGRVAYEELWPGIDLEYTGGAGGTLKYTYVVQPGADPGRIRVSYAGASGVRRTEHGRLEVRTPVGDLVEDRPYVYQELDGRRVEVESEYQVLGAAAQGESERVGYRLGRYDTARPLYIDPAVLRYCGFIGGGGAGTYDLVKGIAVDAAGYAYVMGETSSAAASFPETPGSYDTVFGGAYDLFVAKVKPSPSDATPENNLVYCTYLGGASAEDAGGIAIDGAGNAYVFGDTWSNPGYPLTVGPDTTWNGGSSDAFVTKINATGTGLVYSGLIGGSGVEYGGAAEAPAGIAVDASGSAYVLGYTSSNDIVTVVGPDTSWNGGAFDAFVAKVKADGSGFDYLGYVGGSGDDYGYAIAIDSSGNAYVAGATNNAAGFPAAIGPDTSHNGGYDGFICRIKPTPSNATPTNNYDYCGYVGGTGWEYVTAVAVIPSGASQGTVFIGGYTDSAAASFPDKVGPDTSFNGGTWDGFVAKVNANPNNATPENNYAYCGYIGGSGTDYVRGIAIDASEYVYVAGYTSATEATFPVVVGPDLTYNGGAYDAFVAKLKLNPSNATPANNYVYSGYIGGSLEDVAYALAVSGGDAYVAGYTYSSQAQGFPVVVGPDLTYNGGDTDGFVAKISDDSGCCSLSTAEVPGSTITVTGTGQFEMQFATAKGGSIDQFFDLAEDPSKTYDLAGGTTAQQGLFEDEVGSANWNSNYPNGQVYVLEATPVRAKVRQATRYQNGAVRVDGLEGVGDYAISPVGRMAIGWSRKRTTAVPYTQLELNFSAHYLDATSPPYDSWNAYGQTALLDLTNEPYPGNDLALLKNDVPNARTDFLSILDSAGWTGPDGAENLTGGRQGWGGLIETNWIRYTDGTLAAPNPAVPYSQLAPGGGAERWNLLMYFKPTNLGSNASPWLDPAVTSRSADYRGPSATPVAQGAGWADANENTASDPANVFFNDSEAAYVFDLSQAAGLTFDMDGSGTTRYSPFFKIRQWRSFVESPTVTLEGVALRKDVDYKAALKPISRGHWANQLSWHCSVQSLAACDAGNLDVGSTSFPIDPGVAIVAGRYGNAGDFTAGTDQMVAGGANFSATAGAVEFWYQPHTAHTDGVARMLWWSQLASGGTHCYRFEKLDGANANQLLFEVVVGATNSTCTTGGTAYSVTVPSTSYSWRPNDWVHLKTTWNASGTKKLRIVMNGKELASSGTYVAPPSWGGVNFGGCSALCPGGGAARHANGLIDEPHLYTGVDAADDAPTLVAAGGVTIPLNPDEKLASSSQNLTLDFQSPGFNRGRYLFVGSDSKFRGLNVSLLQAGAGVGASDLGWEYWSSATGEWEAMATAGVGFTDGTNSLTKNGTLYWSPDPPNWAPFSINGGPDLYYLRAHITTGITYSQQPIERQIRTDILLFQHCRDVTTAAQTFAFSVPPTTAVKLQSFSATPGDASVMLDWRTASELDNLGFHLHRGPAEGGPWTRLNSELIPGLGSSAVGKAYSFRDAGLVNGTRYFYRLEDVDASSKVTSHDPVSAVPVAGAAGGAPGSEPPSGGANTKKKAASPPSCPDWVVAAYASAAGASASAASLSCTRHGDPEAVSLGVVSRDSRQATLELKTGGFYALREASGKVRVFVPGFDFPQDPQAAALPFRRALVEAVVGRRAQLGGVRALDQVSFRGLVPAPLGKAEMQASLDGTVRPTRRAVERAATSSPGASLSAELARLLPSVFQGETKSAVVQITPLRYDARRGQIVLAKRVLVKLLFTARETGESGRGSFGRREKPQAPLAGERLARLFTTSRGLHAVSFEQLFPGRERGFLASQLRLERQGQAQAFHVGCAALGPCGGPDGFGPGSVLYFYADATASSTGYSPELAWELLRAQGGLQMPLVSAAPAGAAVTAGSTGLASFEVNRFYQPGLLEAPELWLWEGLASGTTKVLGFALSGTDASAVSGAAELELYLQGASESGGPVDHHVSVSVNGVPAGEAQFAGKKPYRMRLSLPASLLREGGNELQLTNVADAGVASYVFLDRFTFAHPQLSSLAGGRFDGVWPESGSVSLQAPGPVSGRFVVVDVTRPALQGVSGSAGPGTSSSSAAPVWLTGYETTAGGVRFRVEAGHRYWVGSDSALFSPRVSQVQPSGLKSAVNQADYLLIAPGAFLAAAEPLLARRADQGLTTRAVAFEEIADEFGHGQPSAEAIKDFLSFAFQSWARPSARYVLLLGDSSYDPRNFTGTSQPSPLPALWTKTSYLWTVSDPQLAAVNGEDALPDLAIGRLPATTLEQASSLIQKLLAWEDSGRASRVRRASSPTTRTSPGTSRRTPARSARAISRGGASCCCSVSLGRGRAPRSRRRSTRA